MQAVTITQISPEELERIIELTLDRAMGKFILQLQLKSVSEKEENELFNVHQCAEFLKLSPATVYTMVSNGDLPVMKRSKRLYFSKADLMEYLKAGRKKTNSEIKELSKNKP